MTRLTKILAMTPDQAAFRQFEQDGWRTSAPVYYDAITGVNSQSIGPMLAAAHVGAGSEMLDLAAGPGHISAAAASLGASVIGIDFSAEMVAEAQQRFPSLEFQQGDAEQIPLADGSRDAVVMGFALFHFARPELALLECFRVLRPGAYIAFTAWGLPTPGSGLAIAGEALQTYAKMDLGLPEGTPFHRFSEAEESARTLMKAGFTDCGFKSVPQTWRMSDPNELYEGLSRASVRMKTVFQMQTEKIQGQLRRAMAEAVSAQAMVDGQYQIEMPAALSWARKPGPA